MVGCTQKEPLSFEVVEIDTASMIYCDQIDCAVVQISLPSILTRHPLAQKINDGIEKSAAIILHTDASLLPISLEEAVRDFNAEFQTIQEEFPEETVPYEASIAGQVSYQNEHIISIVMDSYLFSGGAHGYNNTSFININTQTGEKIVNSNLFKDSLNFQNHVEKIFRKQYKIPEKDPINSTGFFFDQDVFVLPEAIGFTKKEIILYYNQYEISSYAEGAVELVLDKEKNAHFFNFQIQ